MQQINFPDNLEPLFTITTGPILFILEAGKEFTEAIAKVL